MPILTTIGSASVKGFGFGAGGGLTATGGTITEYGGFRVHTFTSNGTFEIEAGETSELDVMVIGGGGGGGQNHGGGAGASGAIVLTQNTSGPASYSISVGGGAGSAALWIKHNWIRSNR